MIEQPETGRSYCAADGACLVGTVSILFTVNTVEDGRTAWLEDMVAHPSRRGQGIGQRLLNEAIAVARAAGCNHITLLTDLHQ